MVDRISRCMRSGRSSVVGRGAAALLLCCVAGLRRRGRGLRPEGTVDAAEAPPARHGVRRRPPSRHRCRGMSLPGAPFCTRHGSALEGMPLDALARQLRHAAVRLFAARDAASPRPLIHARCEGRRSSRLLRDEGELRIWPCCRPLRAPAAASTSSRAASCNACSPPVAPPIAVVFSGVGKTRARDAPGACRPACAASTSRARRTAGALARWRWPPGDARAVSLRVNPDVDRRDAPVHLHRAARQQVRHRPRRGAGGVPPRRRTAGAASGRHRLPHRLADHAGRALPRCAGPPARPRRSRSRPTGIAIRTSTSAAGSASPTATSSRRRAEALIARLLHRLDARGHGGRELLLEPGRSLVGNAGALVTEVLYLKPGAQKNFCIVDAAMNDLLRPALYEAWMAIEPCVASRQGSICPLGRRRPGVRVGRLDRPRPRTGGGSPATRWRCCRPGPTAWRWPATTTAVRAPPRSCCRRPTR